VGEIPEGNAIVYCQGAFGTTNGKTAHGLIRRTSRYRILSVVDGQLTGRDAGEVLDGKANGIPIYDSISTAVNAARRAAGVEAPRGLKPAARLGQSPTHLVVGLAPDGGRLSAEARQDIIEAIRLGLNVDSGLHDFP